MLVYVLAGSIAALAIARLLSLYHYVDPRLATVVEAKRRARKEEIDRFRAAHPARSLSAQAKRLVEACENSTGLLRLFESGQLTVEEAVLCFCHAALEADDRVNCITEVMFDEALAQARLLDGHFRETGRLFGPMHGLPVSLKDAVDYKGRDSTVGVIKFAFRPKAAHAVVVQQLLDAGAVPFVKTNVPQTMMTFECRNPLWGQTEHPSRPGVTPGGSSGGEAALIALRGSMLGIGNDVGGSLRIPAHFSGICALKPSYNRISFQGSTGYYPASLLIHPVNGPMGRTVDDLVALSAVLMGPNPYDARAIRMPFQAGRLSANKRLRFGLALTDGFAAPVPAVTRALLLAKEALIGAGHEVVDFAYPPNIVELISLYYAIISGDGGHHFLQTLRGEPIDPSMKALFCALKMDPRLHRVVSRVLPAVVADARVTSLVDRLGVKMTRDVLVLEGERVRAQHDFDARWREAKIDVLLCPPNAMPAVPYDLFTQLNFTASYTVLWNLLDYVAGVMPVTRVSSAHDVYPAEHRKPSGSYFQADALESILHNHYDPQVMDGLPVGVQVVGMPYHEEEVLGAMRALEQALHQSEQSFKHL